MLYDKVIENLGEIEVPQTWKELQDYLKSIGEKKVRAIGGNGDSWQLLDEGGYLLKNGLRVKIYRDEPHEYWKWPYSARLVTRLFGVGGYAPVGWGYSAEQAIRHLHIAIAWTGEEKIREWGHLHDADPRSLGPQPLNELLQHEAAEG